jgi:hypothetical protein
MIAAGVGRNHPMVVTDEGSALYLVTAGDEFTKEWLTPSPVAFFMVDR